MDKNDKLPHCPLNKSCTMSKLYNQHHYHIKNATATPQIIVSTEIVFQSMP